MTSSRAQRPDFSDQDSAFADNLAPKQTEHSPSHKRTEFFPWHKPRKQWIRKEQWGESIKQLIESIELTPQAEPLHYLSLPGPDMLDVRTIQPVCAAKKVRLRFLGINAGDDDKPGDQAFHAALLSQVRSLPYIDTSSEIVPDKFEHLTKSDKIAYQRVIQDRKSYDVINLDLCGSVAEKPPGTHDATTTNALQSLLRHQAQSRSKDWILFLTTRSDKKSVHEGTMRLLVDWINTQMSADGSFKAALTANGLLCADDFKDGLLKLEQLSSDSYCKSFAIGISNWIRQTLIDQVPAWRVDMLPLYAYHVNMMDSACDMLSLGFYCKRINCAPKPDSFGITKLPVSGSSVSAEDVKQKGIAKINEKVGKKTDLDVFLYKNKEVYAECLSGSATLLSEAHYDEAKYIEWAGKETSKLEALIKEFNLAPD